MGGEVKSMRTVGALVCVGLITAGCAATRGALPPGSGDKLYEAVTAHGSPQLSVIDARTQIAERRLPLGAPSHDWTHLYSIAGNSLLDTDPLTGSTPGTMILPARYRRPPARASRVPAGTLPPGHLAARDASHPASRSPRPRLAPTTS